MTEDYSKPRNLSDSLFNDFQLPEHSKMVLKVPPTNDRKSITGSKYAQEEEDDGFLNLQLGEVSKVVHRIEPATASNSQSDRSEERKSSKPRSKMTIGARNHRKKPSKKPEPEIKEEIDIDNQIGEVAEWGEKGVKNNSDEDDFDQAEQVGESPEQQEARRRLQQKLRTGFGQKNKGGGLKAKAEQLRRQKQRQEQGQPKILSTEMLNDPKPKHKNEVLKTFSSDHDETSAELINSRDKRQPEIPAMMEESQDDPWDKVNQKTIQHYQNVQQKRKDMNIQAVLSYYKQEFKFDETDIELEDSAPAKDQEQKEKGCLDMLLDCFKDQPKKKKNTKNNSAIAKRLIAISKKQLTNTEEQYFMLQQIWNRIVNEPFSRYGSHWNKIGFQGRDPATDLRSTGVLSLLQWVLYIQAHPKIAKEQGSWSVEAQYPLALTHIKITGAFLDLLLKGKIQGEQWDDFQRRYNALVIGVLDRVKSKFDGADNLGTLVEEQVRNLKQNYIKEFSRYDSQHKK